MLYQSLCKPAIVPICSKCLIVPFQTWFYADVLLISIWVAVGMLLWSNICSRPIRTQMNLIGRSAVNQSRYRKQKWP